MSKLYKVTDVDGSAYHGGVGKWPLPEGGEPGAWLEVKGKIIPCRRGLHLCYAEGLVGVLGPVIFEAEYEGELIAVAHDDGLDRGKVVVRKARLLRRVETWNERTARLFAADCAERALTIFEREHPNDDRPRKAIEAARAYARGEIDDAARATAEAAAWDAARAAAWAAAESAARAAAKTAVEARAEAAARAAAWTVAWTAAGGVARAAARSVTGAAAWDAKKAAAWDDAWAAERRWQTARLFQYIDEPIRIDA